MQINFNPFHVLPYSFFFVSFFVSFFVVFEVVFEVVFDVVFEVVFKVVFFVVFLVVFLFEDGFFAVAFVFFPVVLLLVDFAAITTPPYDGNTNYNYSI